MEQAHSLASEAGPKLSPKQPKFSSAIKSVEEKHE
jgi:hypothetical protein